MARLLPALVVLVLCSPTLAQFHVVASRRAVVREFHATNADPVIRLDRGDTAACFLDPEGNAERVDNFYHIILDDGREGWVSRFTVRLREGPPPASLPGTTDFPAEVAVASTHLRLGEPSAYTVLRNDGYVVGYDHRLKIPVWVQYRLRQVDFQTDRDRSNDFRVDTRIHQEGRALLEDYRTAMSWELWNSLGMTPPQAGNAPNYARGHLVPAGSQTRTEQLERDTYLLTNMAPQVHRGFNAGTWSALERRVRGWVEERGPLTIVMGPVFLPAERQLTPARTQAEREGAVETAVVLAQPPTERQVIYNVVGDRDVAVPTAFFKVVVDDAVEGDPEILAFLVRNYSRTGRDPADLLVSVDEIERLTGLDLLTNLDINVQTRIERTAAEELW